jgi:guanylate kinase
MLNKNCVCSWPVGKVFIISAPAGAGKTTLAKKLVTAFSNVAIAPTLTTRNPREGEIQGEDYFFVTRQEFQSRISHGDLLEYIEMHGELYGTLSQEVDTRRRSGQHVLLVIDTRGALALEKQLDAVLIFIHPPSEKELRSRLTTRNSESDTSLSKRLQWAPHELQESSKFHYQIINDDLEEAFTVLSSIVIAESHRTHNHGVVHA